MPSASAVSETLRRGVAASPAALLGALALVSLVVVSASGGGYAPGDWYPAALYVLVLAAMAVVWVPAGRPPVRAATVACVALAGYALWSFLSIAWADQQGDAWDGANRTALYALLFGLFALWPLRGRAAAALVGGFALAIGALAVVELLRVAGASDPSGFFIDGRLATPVGYPSGDAALWSLAFWPCAVFGSRRETPPALRGAYVSAAVVLAGMALMAQSRGWLFALPLVAVLFLVLTPGRVRTALTLVLILAAVGVAILAALDVYDKHGRALSDALGSAAAWTLAAAVVAGGVAALAGVGDRRRPVSRVAGRRAGAALLACALVTLVAGAAVYVALRGDPFTDVAHAWNQFKTQPEPKAGEQRLGRLGSNRYDFWRVAWDRFEHAPLIGIGSDNFQQAYLRQARSREQPRYPHSVELRTLSQTGLVGALLLGTALVAGLMAAGRAVAGRSGPGRAAAAAALGGFVYWLVHGSVDWFWEVPALGGAAFALLGIAAGLAPRRPARTRRPLAWRPRTLAAAGAAALVLAASLGAPALAYRLVDQASGDWPRHPARAFDDLDTAADLNPLSTQPKLVAGRIALSLHRPRTAERYFGAAIERDGNEPYAHLQLGALLFDGGRRAEGLRLLERAARLEPRARITERALARARAGLPVDVAAINAALLSQSREIVR